MFVRKQPVLPNNALPESGNFTRLNFIVATFGTVLRILGKYETSDFASKYLYLYCLSGLCKNLKHMNDILHDHLRMWLEKLMDKFQLDSAEKRQLFDEM